MWSMFSSMTTGRQGSLLIVIGGLTGMIFGLDLLTPRGISVWVLYIVPLLLAVWSSYGKLPLILSSICTPLIVIGYLFSPATTPNWISLTNRAFGLIVIWIVTLLLLKQKQAEERRNQVEQEREQLVYQLQEASANVRTLKGLLRFCSGCEKVRDDRGDWKDLPTYVKTNSEAKFQPDLCPSCGELMFPDFYRGLTQRLH